MATRHNRRATGKSLLPDCYPVIILLREITLILALTSAAAIIFILGIIIHKRHQRRCETSDERRPRPYTEIHVEQEIVDDSDATTSTVSSSRLTVTSSRAAGHGSWPRKRPVSEVDLLQEVDCGAPRQMHTSMSSTSDAHPRAEMGMVQIQLQADVPNPGARRPTSRPLPPIPVTRQHQDSPPPYTARHIQIIY
jgi:hypothetical protein